jgi:regulatory protein YycI of two-component signal transduction system YycFG
MDVQKKIEKFKKRYEEADSGQTVKVIEFKRKHFKESLSTSVGFGYQDMKDDAKDFFKWMVTEGIDFDMVPDASSQEDFSVLVNTVKCEC